MNSFALLLPPKSRLAIIMAGMSSVSQRQPMDSLPWVTSISSTTYRGSSGAWRSTMGSGLATRPLGRDARADSSAVSTRLSSALPQ